MKKIEFVVIGIFIVGIIFNLLDFNNELLLISSMLISLFYSIFSFAIFNGVELKKIFRKNSYKGIAIGQIIISIVCGFILAILIFGIESKLLSTQIGGINSFVRGIKLSGVIFLFSLILFIKNKSEFFKNMLIRFGIFLLIGLIVYYTY